MKIKDNRGVTLTSVTIYVIALTVVVVIIARISTYFYRNINNVTTNVAADAEYTKFNSYFTDEINIEENEVATCGTDANGMNYIIFSKTQNQYSYYNNGIYRNKTKIVKDVDSCQIKYNTSTKIITVNLTIKNKSYSTQYTVVK